MWIAERENRSAFGSKRRRHRRRRLELDADEGMSVPRLRRLQQELREERSATNGTRCDRTGRRLRCLARTTGLTRTDVGILELLLRYQTQPIIESMVDDVFGRAGRNINALNLRGRALSALLGISAGTVHRLLANGAPLVRSGLVSIGNDDDLIVVSRLHRITTAPGDASLDVYHLLLPAASPTELEWSDFDHIAQDRNHVERLLAGALDSGPTGVNVLLHGPPGTGKTEFCKVLAERLGVTLFTVGTADTTDTVPPEIAAGTLPAASTCLLLAKDRTGYTNLCRLITIGRLRRPKVESCVTWPEISRGPTGSSRSGAAIGAC